MLLFFGFLALWLGLDFYSFLEYSIVGFLEWG